MTHEDINAFSPMAAPSPALPQRRRRLGRWLLIGLLALVVLSAGLLLLLVNGLDSLLAGSDDLHLSINGEPWQGGAFHLGGVLLGLGVALATVLLCVLALLCAVPLVVAVALAAAAFGVAIALAVALGVAALALSPLLLPLLLLWWLVKPRRTAAV